MSLSPLTFTGVSTFSQDFQTILTRATDIASLPVKALQNQQADLLQQKLLLTGINDGVASLASSVSALGSLGSQKAIGASSSDSTKVAAVSVSATDPAVYTISDITSVARAAAESSLTGYADSNSAPVSSTGTVKLTVGSNEYTIDISSSNTLTGLRNVINGLDAGVTAAVLTTGTGPTPYYLSITANSAGAKTLTLHDDPAGANTSLLTNTNQGANTEFKLNGAFVSKTSTYINDVVPGVTFNILETTSGSETVALNLYSDRSKISTALKSFVSSYNSLVTQINGQVGEGAGLLSGDYIVREVQSRLREVTSYTGLDSIKGLADLGVEFDNKGVATFNQSAFDGLSESQLGDAFEFLGSATSGFGGLSKNLSQISDSVTGLAQIQLERYTDTDRNLTAQIAALNSRISDMQKALSAKLQYADALLASLQSQQSALDASIQSLNLTLYGKNDS